MDRISTTEARQHLSKLINRAADDYERIILTRRGKAIAAIVPVDDVDLLEEIEDRIDIEEAEAALAEVREHGTIPFEQIKAELGL